MKPKKPAARGWHGRLAALLIAGAAGVAMALPALAAKPADEPATTATAAPAASKAKPRMQSDKVKRRLDHTGRKRVGKASYYANKFSGRKMADGQRMNPRADNAASKTLPLGTTAKVTNLETGKSAVVTIQDRGPYVEGRIVDLSPATAQKIGITKQDGVADVEVAPIAVPLPDGSVKPGAAANP